MNQWRIHMRKFGKRFYHRCERENKSMDWKKFIIHCFAIFLTFFASTAKENKKKKEQQAKQTTSQNQFHESFPTPLVLRDENRSLIEFLLSFLILGSSSELRAKAQWVFLYLREGSSIELFRVYFDFLSNSRFHENVHAIFKQIMMIRVCSE